MRMILHIWRQSGPEDKGGFQRHELDGVEEDMSFLEMLDTLNERIIAAGDDPVTFDSDCREGICGACSCVINGRPHGPGHKSTTCQVRMRAFKDGDEIWIEPFRSGAFPIVKDLMVDRTAFDRIIEAGGYISAHSGPKPEPNASLVPHPVAEEAMDAAECIGCGACVASCPNGAAMLFTGAKVSHLGLLPQGQPERWKRARTMVAQMDAEGFGACTNYAECQDACPKGISIRFIGRMNRDFMKASLCEPDTRQGQLKAH
ncbi:MAG: succinate dehydrogenase/fumarate reductase iron-sulfur subunit [Phycisphaerales bacterium]|nr:succinate dehydrogenase/fumarate reductase iron-sulfur subunit [Phycisphaerales bacterium]